MAESSVRSVYRQVQQGSDLVYFNVKVKQTDLAIGIDSLHAGTVSLEQVEHRIIRLRADIETYAENSPDFLTSLEPVPVRTQAPEVVKRMARAALAAGVGPMAAVAGTIAEMVGEELTIKGIPNVLVENGGDIYIASDKERIVALYAGASPFTGRLGLRIRQGFPLGVCTSSATVGPSLSLGRADAAVIIAESAALADAVATAAGNQARTAEDLEAAAQVAMSVAGVRGALIVLGDKMAAIGEIELTAL
jgi:ApbE superfamily uncharacterized protein (UPF0280 family)